MSSKQTTLDSDAFELSSVPYPVPFDESVSEHQARNHHREWYWNQHEIEDYECPDCGRGNDAVCGFDVHHIDENPRNGDPENLIALCERCHKWRHETGPTLKGLSIEEWKTAFVDADDLPFDFER